ncbi:uncharacterized protein LOC110759980 [Prunus avium]|uniref:Uncharacterized protein LOC110759980 n=1 Tax=Prunus avium TaxID=42229 RepID=A0A6P5SUH9_PRUAV|nr:uncharacterized protein LOC110759980 [Prunus avium]
MAAATVVPATGVIANLKLLNNYNYDEWSFRVKIYLLAEDLWDFVEATTEPPKPEDGEAEFKAWRKNNAKALYAIQSSCGDDTYSLIGGITTAKLAWDTLEEELKPAKAEELVTLMPLEDLNNIHLTSNDGHESNSSYYSEFGQHQPFIDFVTNGDWDSAKEYLGINPDVIRKRGSVSGATALHLAVGLEYEDMAMSLVELMAEEDLEIQDANGVTAIGFAANKGLAQVAKCIVEKNKKILSLPCFGDMIPLLEAYSSGHWKLARFFYSLTPLEALLLDNGCGGAELISESFIAKEFDIALDLIRRCPNLAITTNFSGLTPLHMCATTSSGFLSGTPLKFWQKWIYDSIHIPPATTTLDIRINVEKPEDGPVSGNDLIARSGICRLRGLVPNPRHFFGIDHIYKIKWVHERTAEVLHSMCEVIKDKSPKQVIGSVISAAIFEAIKQGRVELIDEIIETNPLLFGLIDENGKSLLQFAIECRQEKVYFLLYELSGVLPSLLAVTDKLNNTLLHSAASLSPLAQLNHIQGAALQMQRELQWFQEVEKIVPPKVLEVVNDTDGMTARELFTKTHKELAKEGERSMKETATSCTVVGALIITIMFTAAFTVPGGNNGDTGMPMFLDRMLFKVFMVSVALSLFSSTTSVMTFLGILTSRYAETDFLKSLPKKMIIGLFTLFFSVATMMIGFVSTLFIMLDGKSWIVIPIILLASAPIISFVWMQFPLLVEIFAYTYGAGIFSKKVKPLVI